MKFVSKGPINNKPALVHLKPWCQKDNKPLSEAMIVHLNIYVSLGL